MTIFAFACLGFLIGNLIGLSAESTLSVVIPLLFSFGGGSAVAFLHKLTPEERKLGAAAVVALSLSCLIGAYTGIMTSEYRLLSPETNGKVETRSIEENKYLRTVSFSKVQLIDQRYKVDSAFSAEEAYEKLYKLVSDGVQ